MGSCNFKVYIQKCDFGWLSGRKQSQGQADARAAGGWKDAETLNVPKPLRTGTGAIR